MTDCKGEVIVTLTFKVSVTGSFSPHYKEAEEILEQNAIEEIMDALPNKLQEDLTEQEAECVESEITGEFNPTEEDDL